jgi:hypothetical protein
MDRLRRSDIPSLEVPRGSDAGDMIEVAAQSFAQNLARVE